MSENINTDEPLTPKRAFTLNTQDEHTQSEIADAYDVHHNTVSKRKREYEEQKETAESVVESRIEEYDLENAITDEVPEENPYDVVECPSCNTDIDKPDSAGKHDCPNCETSLKFSESEL